MTVSNFRFTAKLRVSHASHGPTCAKTFRSRTAFTDMHQNESKNRYIINCLVHLQRNKGESNTAMRFDVYR
jgi:hypothetical protein